MWGSQGRWPLSAWGWRRQGERLTGQDRQRRGGSGKPPGLPWVAPSPSATPSFLRIRGASRGAVRGWGVGVTSGTYRRRPDQRRGAWVPGAAANGGCGPAGAAVFAQISAVAALPLCVHRGHLAAQTPARRRGPLRPGQLCAREGGQGDSGSNRPEPPRGGCCPGHECMDMHGCGSEWKRGSPCNLWVPKGESWVPEPVDAPVGI